MILKNTSKKFALKMGLKGNLRIQMAEQFLHLHLTSDGGLATFFLEKELRRFMKSLPEDDLSGWMGTHPCITVSAAKLPSFNELLVSYLVDNQFLVC